MNPNLSEHNASGTLWRQRSHNAAHVSTKITQLKRTTCRYRSLSYLYVQLRDPPDYLESPVANHTPNTSNQLSSLSLSIFILKKLNDFLPLSLIHLSRVFSDFYLRKEEDRKANSIRIILILVLLSPLWEFPQYSFTSNFWFSLFQFKGYFLCSLFDSWKEPNRIEFW